jgi:hypothetical protein
MPISSKLGGFVRVSATGAGSADKHGILHEDALRAIGTAYYVESEFEEPRLPGRSVSAA